MVDHVAPDPSTEPAMAQRVPWVPRTADDLEAIPQDRNRYEIIDGVLYVTPAPSVNHQRVVGALHVLIRPYVASIGLEVLMAPLDVRASPVTQVEPDILVLPRVLASALTTRWAPMSALLLAVEVLSPSTASVDRGRKRDLYMSEGVDQYWIVDPEARRVAVWRPGDTEPAMLHADAVLHWHPVPDVAALEIDLRTVFEELT